MAPAHSQKAALDQSASISSALHQNAKAGECVNGHLHIAGRLQRGCEHNLSALGQQGESKQQARQKLGTDIPWKHKNAPLQLAA